MSEKNMSNVKLTVEFTEATTRENIKSKENISTLFGKIKKVITDLHSSAFTGNAAKVNGHTVESDVPADAKFTDTEYTDVSDTGSGLMTSAQKKKLDDITTMTGATEAADGKSGLVPSPSAGNQDKFLRGDGTWAEISESGGGGSDDKLPLTGGVVTGNVQQSGPTTDYNTYKFRNISFGTSTTPVSDATYGGNGSIYFYYK